MIQFRFVRPDDDRQVEVSISEGEEFAGYPGPTVMVALDVIEASYPIEKALAKAIEEGAEVIPAPPVPSVASPNTVLDYQFAGQAAAEKIISDDDAMSWVGRGVVPDSLVQAVKRAVPDSDRQKRVLLFLAGTTVYPRNHELTPLLAGSFGKDTPEKVDAFFIAASQR